MNGPIDTDQDTIWLDIEMMKNEPQPHLFEFMNKQYLAFWQDGKICIMYNEPPEGKEW